MNDLNHKAKRNHDALTEIKLNYKQWTIIEGKTKTLRKEKMNY